MSIEETQDFEAVCAKLRSFPRGEDVALSAAEILALNAPFETGHTALEGKVFGRYFHMDDPGQTLIS